MEFKINIYHIITILGVVQGLILAVILVFPHTAASLSAAVTCGHF